MTSFRCDEEILKTEDESSKNVVQLRTEISKLSVENEKYRQELYELQRKFETNLTMQSELVELNEALEETVKEREAATKRRIHEMEDKHVAHIKLLQERYEEAESELARKSKENQDLRLMMKVNNEKLLVLSQAECLVGKDENTEILKRDVDRLLELSVQEAETRKRLEDALEISHRESNELREILAATKGQLAESDQLLESTREELLYYRMELESLKTAPATEACKGNSLFAEVEDRRRMTLEQMIAMRNSYQEAKRSFQAKEAEIKALKAERAMLLRKWEDDTVERIQQDASLCDMYKARIAELERQLKDEQKKQKRTAKSQQTADNNFTFLQSLVDTKKKQVEELRAKIENDSIKSLLEEEAKHKIGKQLRYWRYRAMSGEAQLISIKNRLECDPSSSNVEILSTIESCLKGKKQSESPTGEEYSINVEPSCRETTIANQTVLTLESLMDIPKTLNSRAMDAATSTSAQNMDETVCVIGPTNPEGVSSVNETIVTSPPIIHENMKIIKTISSMETKRQEPNETRGKVSAGKSSDDSEHYNEKSDCRIYVAPILKSSLANTNSHQNMSTKASIKETNERDRKTLRFTEDTIDPPSKPLKKQASAKPQYPIIFISCDKSKV